MEKIKIIVISVDKKRQKYMEQQFIDLEFHLEKN